MRRGRPLKPIISLESVKAALKMLELSYVADSGLQPLKNLLLVDVRLQQITYPNAEDIRGWVLRQFIVDCIISQLNQLRVTFRLTNIRSESAIDVEINHFKQSVEAASGVLTGWHVLYLRYVRPDLNLTVQELTELAAAHTRTLQRYQDKAVEQLRDFIIEQEIVIRLKHKKSRLRMALPEAPAQLVGRDSELNSILQIIHQNTAQPIIVSGINGIGKTAFVAQIVHLLIERDNVDEVIWIEDPATIEYIPNQIHDVLTPRSSQLNWQDVLHYQRCVVVIDSINQLDMVSSNWRALLNQLRNAILICTTSNHGQIWLPAHHLELAPLDNSSMSKLITNYIGDDLPSDSPKIFSGNPALLMTAMQQHLRTGDDITQIAKRLRHRQIETLSDEDKVNILLAHFAGDKYRSELQQATGIMNKLLSSHITTEIVHVLLSDEGVLNRLQNRLAAFMDEQVSDMVRYMVLKFLSQVDVRLDGAFVSLSLRSLETETLVYNELQQWRYLYERYFIAGNYVSDDRLQYQFAVALRRSFQHAQAVEELSDLLMRSGRAGDFGLQMNVLYQLGVLAQTRTQFEDALAYYHQVVSYAERLNEYDLMYQVSKQQARIAIARQNAVAAIDRLQTIDTTNDSVAFVLYCEAKMLLSDYDFLRAAIPDYLQTDLLDDRLRSTLHTILARCYQAQLDSDSAILHFNEALSLAERGRDRFDIARARTNLCAASIMKADRQDKRYLDDIINLLNETESIQIAIKDRLGQEATHHNLRHAKRLRISFD